MRSDLWTFRSTEFVTRKIKDLEELMMYFTLIGQQLDRSSLRKKLAMAWSF